MPVTVWGWHSMQGFCQTAEIFSRSASKPITDELNKYILKGDYIILRDDTIPQQVKGN